MSAGMTSTLREQRAARWFVPVLAALFAAVAVIFTPGTWWESALVIASVGLFALWVRWPAIMPVLGLFTPAAVFTACIGGDLEPSLFLTSLLALVAAAWEDRRWLAWAIVILCILTPVLSSLAAPHERIGWPVWVLGIGFPAVIGLIIRRLERVSAELARARQELAERAVIDERRRIGRDVHDLVGHGLAAVMLQVTGARHVLHRDPAAADEALRVAEEVGRESMQELRRTVELLRSETAPTDAPPASLRQIRQLARTYAAGGLRVDFTESGDLDAALPSQALAAYRIAQQALANAAQHAADARTVVRLKVTPEVISLHVESIEPGGAAPHGHDERPARTGHGLTSMRERARVAGGEFWAGPTATGWSVRCELPATPADASAAPAKNHESPTGSVP